MTTITLTPDEIELAEKKGREIYENAVKLGLPGYSEMPLDEYRAWVASRKAAAANIDVETCECAWCYGNPLDPYGLYEALGELSSDEKGYIDKLHFVRSPGSDGWVGSSDLSPAQCDALYAHGARQRQK